MRRRTKTRLLPIGKYYVRNLEVAQGPASPQRDAAAALVSELKKRGKWPAKPDLIGWYGKKGMRWRDAKSGNFKRCVTLPGDPELITRHEVHAAPPDILVTNYSMLEYMLMRPLERPIFDHTRDWLQANPDERFLLVIDEAHLYRGAAGAEVALLIRRLRMRLGIPADRLQVICTSASFKDPGLRREVRRATHRKKTLRTSAQCKVISSYRSGAGKGTGEDADRARRRSTCESFYESDQRRRPHSHRSRRSLSIVASNVHGICRSALYDALVSFAPMANLINITMTEAQPVDALGEALFDGVPPDVADSGSHKLDRAWQHREKKCCMSRVMLPCRVHSFYRGLAGLWVCTDPQCASLPSEQRGGPAGMLFSQPRDTCDCGARVLELYTCRNCGTAYGRAYTNDIDEPNFLWSEPGGAFRTLSGQFDELAPIDLLLEQPVFHEVRRASRVRPRNRTPEPTASSGHAIGRSTCPLDAAASRRRRTTNLVTQLSGRVSAVCGLRRERRVRAFLCPRSSDEGRPTVPGADREADPGAAAEPRTALRGSLRCEAGRS